MPSTLIRFIIIKNVFLSRRYIIGSKGFKKASLRSCILKGVLDRSLIEMVISGSLLHRAMSDNSALALLLQTVTFFFGAEIFLFFFSFFE